MANAATDNGLDDGQFLGRVALLMACRIANVAQANIDLILVQPRDQRGHVSELHVNA